MSKDKQRLIDYLKHILEAISRIQRYIEDIDEIAFLGNALAHGYFKVDLEIVWRTIERDLPELEVMIESLLSEFH